MLIIILGRLMGIEPTNVGATIRCVNHFATIAMAGVAGIEPTLTVLETAVLPLNYAPLRLPYSYTIEYTHMSSTFIIFFNMV